MNDLHLLCDLSLAAENAVFGQTGPKVGSFDAGYGSGFLARVVGQRKAREIWFLCRFYDSKKAYDWGLINEVVPYENLEKTTVDWCNEILEKSRIRSSDNFSVDHFFLTVISLKKLILTI